MRSIFSKLRKRVKKSVKKSVETKFQFCQKLDMGNEMVAPERLAEVKKAIEALGGKTNLAAAVGVSVKTIDNWLSGKGIHDKNLLTMRKAVAHVVGGEVRYPGSGRVDAVVKVGRADLTLSVPSVVAEASGEYGEFVSVPLREATGSMGGGSMETGRTVKYHLQFRRDWLISKASSDRDLFCVKAFGDSMHPTIPDGSLVLVSPARASFSDGKIYYIRHNGQMFVKRMTGKPGAMVVISDADPTCPAPVVEGDDFEIIGRIIWTAREVD